MTGKQLKNAILQFAIQGKLVAQDPSDEPASALLAQIRKEKEQLLKAGKLKPACRQAGKKDLETTPIADDEKPFEIPESWEWVRLGFVINLLSGQDLTPDRYFDTEKGIPYITGASHFDNGNLKISRWTETPTSVSKKGDLLITCKGTVGTMAYNNIGDIHIARQVMAISPIKIHLPYINVFLEFFVPELEKQAHSIIPGISREILLSAVVPIPPLAEQRRIVAKIEELMPLVEEYGVAQEKLNRLNEALPEALKKSILQQAIQGKLVAQDTTEEPASALLAQIRKEKEQLQKAGKLKKKDLETTPISDDEKSFEIPGSWEWVRLSLITTMYTGNSISENEKKVKYTNVKGQYYIGTKDVGFDHKIDYNNGVSIPEKYQSDFRNAPANSILMCIEGGSAGRKIAITNQIVCFGNKLCCFVPIDGNLKFLYYYLQSPIFFEVFSDSKNGIIGGVSLNKLKELLVPLPPLAEQHRIVARVEELMEMVEGMK